LSPLRKEEGAMKLFNAMISLILKLLFWICFVAVSVLALSPARYLPPLEIFNWWDKAQHAFAFAALALLAASAYPHLPKLRIAVLLCFHGVAVEVLQYWGGFRFGDWQDAVADAVGVVLGLCLAHLVGKLAAFNKPLKNVPDNIG
jgi:VanZ family protein